MRKYRWEVFAMKNKLWTRNFTLIIAASTLGMIGTVCSEYALSLLVLDATGSTLASALTLAVQFVPYFIIPLFIAPIMDRLPRKPILLLGDTVNAVMFGLLGIYIAVGTFNYVGYLFFSLVIACLGAVDELAYKSFFPMLLPEGAEEKGYTVATMTYPIMKVILTPVAVLLYEKVGVANILLMQAVLSLLAVGVEAFIQVREKKHDTSAIFSFAVWKKDIMDALHYLKHEKGISSLYTYMAVTNGIGQGYGPLIMAFFRTSSVLTMGMYSLFAAAEFIGRTVGGLVQYKLDMPAGKKYTFCTCVYFIYDTLDVMLLWLPYPLMLVNRALAGGLGVNSSVMRQAAVQKYIPDEMRSRINAFLDMAMMFLSSLMTLLMGALGEVLDIRLCLTIGGITAMLVCVLTVVKSHKDVKKVFCPEKQV